MKENKDLIRETRKLIHGLVDSKDSKSLADLDYIKNTVRDEVGKFLFKKTERRPMILPVVLEV